MTWGELFYSTKWATSVGICRVNSDKEREREMIWFVTVRCLFTSVILGQFVLVEYCKVWMRFLNKLTFPKISNVRLKQKLTSDWHRMWITLTERKSRKMVVLVCGIRKTLFASRDSHPTCSKNSKLDSASISTLPPFSMDLFVHT